MSAMSHTIYYEAEQRASREAEGRRDPRSEIGEVGVPSRGTGVSRVGRARRAGYWLLAYWLFVIGDLVLCAMCMCMAMCTYCLILKPADQGRAPRKYPRTYPPPPAPPSSCSIMRDAEFHRCVQPMVQPRSAFRIQNEHLKLFCSCTWFSQSWFFS